ncbi:hypothetical protein KAR91_17140 [Candidatus Pacearchaeota archaeon]|nr:hypothetical protein [Candidatus Pacearchaeota archaeon]
MKKLAAVLMLLFVVDVYSEVVVTPETDQTLRVYINGSYQNTTGQIVITPAVEPQDPANPTTALFSDHFDYVVGRDQPEAEFVFIENGWRWAKTQQSFGHGRGYLYTVDTIPGYTGTFPGINSTRVLAMEALPEGGTPVGQGQTDFYLQFGDTDFPENTIPGNVWFQFWVYVNNYTDPTGANSQESGFSWKNKFLYPCNGSYGCQTGKWLVEMGSHSNSPLKTTTTDGFYTYLGDNYIGTIQTNDPQEWWRSRPGTTDPNGHVKSNQWTLVKIHLDTSTTVGTFEMWLTPRGGPTSKVAEWIGGTNGFTWNIPADQVGGHRVLRMPTTFPGGVGGADLLINSWIYMDDFYMSESETDLPTY